MKTRFSTIDICALLPELQARLLGMRVGNVYDINTKTYLIKLARAEEKAVLLIESGIRIHTTDYEWPKNMAPSSFAMKLRKHLKTRRLEKIEQLGIDRIVDMQFGSNEAAYHVILELYDKGNIVLTDYDYTILNILRPRTDESQDVRFAVKEKYPVADGRKRDVGPLESRLSTYLADAKPGDNLRKLLVPPTVYGAALIEHCLLSAGFASNAQIGKEILLPQDTDKLTSVLRHAEEILEQVLKGTNKGIITQKSEKKVNPSATNETQELLTYVEFHPLLFKQFEKNQYLEMPSFDKAIDEFYSKIESQKLEVKTLQQEKAALKKLENVQKDHDKRLEDLRHEQDEDKLCAQLIEINLGLVDRAITVISSAIANQLSWEDIDELVAEAKDAGDPVASSIKALHLDTNHISMMLGNPDEADVEEEKKRKKAAKQTVDIDLGLSAYANARKYYEKKRSALFKEAKTIDASKKALKSAERKTVEMLKEVQVTATLNKARKNYWFEKFLWTISSDNMLIIGGRDRQQNELIVRRYLRKGDLYVHADLHGASSIVIKNPSGAEVPPRTLMEAGSMALCNSAAWEAKIVTSAWWVYDHQVSKTAPAGEYLTTGSFMIRGKKNYLPHSQLIYGFGLLFKLDESCIERHQGERQVKATEVDEEALESATAESETFSVLEEAESESESVDDLDKEHKSAIAKQSDDGSSHNEETEQSGDQDTDKHSDEDEEESEFPDTDIHVTVTGDKFTVRTSVRTTSQSSHSSDVVKELLETDRAQVVTKSSGKMSAKQRRELRKQRKGKGGGGGQTGSTDDRTEADDDNGSDTDIQSSEADSEDQLSTGSSQSSQPKRGQKGKMKKIKAKYKDQDDEERKFRMEILASAGSTKQQKKEKELAAKGKQQQQQHTQPARNKQQGMKPRPTLADITDLKPTEDGELLASEAVNPVDVDEDSGDEEDKTISEDAGVLASLTGQPVGEDILLFAVPVCAPYNSLLNYKYKVKLTPGSTKRGKASQMALNVFMHDKSINPHEKDLIRSLKGIDISRNIPGKVKVLAPNLQKLKAR